MPGEVFEKNAYNAWTFLVELAEKSMQWDTTRVDYLHSRFPATECGFYDFSNSLYVESRHADMESRTVHATSHMFSLSCI